MNHFPNIAITIILLLIYSNAGRAEKTPVWIDADPVCGIKVTYDVDDCWAILYAVKSGKLDIFGLSTVFGNGSIDEAHSTAESLLEMLETDGFKVPVIHKGSGAGIKKKADDNIATKALYSILKKRKLTIIALGPLTNIGILLQNHPEIAGNIDGIIAVAGNRPDQRRFFIGESKIMHFHDMNFRKDPEAFEIAMNLGVPLTLLPFEVAQKVTITAEELQIISKQGNTEKILAYKSQKWIEFWEDQFNIRGFHPFDYLAVGYLLMPQLFSCENMSGRIKRRRSRFVERSELQVFNNIANTTAIKYCFDVADSFKKSLLTIN